MNKAWRTFWHPVGGLYGLDDLSEFLDLPKFVNKRDKPETVGLDRREYTHQKRQRPGGRNRRAFGN